MMIAMIFIVRELIATAAGTWLLIIEGNCFSKKALGIRQAGSKNWSHIIRVCDDYGICEALARDGAFRES